MRSAAEAAPSFLYLPDLAGAGDTLTLAADDARYLAKVVRAREGERVTATDGAGLLVTLVLESVRPEVVLAVESRTHVAAPPRARLLCGAPEGERGDWLVEKLAELGVTEFVPVDGERNAWPEAVRLERWERLAVAALRQSRSAWLLRLSAPCSLAEALADAPVGTGWLADPDGAAPDTRPTPPGSDLTGAVGPSSGFSDAERKLLSTHGFVPVKLAGTRLRTETAAIALASHWAARR